MHRMQLRVGVVMRNTFLTVGEGESEGAKHAFKRS